MFAQFEKGIAFAAFHLFEIEDVLVNATAFSMSSNPRWHILIASINLHTHILASEKEAMCPALFMRRQRSADCKE